MLYVLLIIAGLLSWFALKNKAFLLGLLAGAGWVVAGAYVAAYPPGALTAGDTIHGMLLIVLFGAGITMPLVAMRLQKSKEYDVTAGIVGGNREEGEIPKLVASVRESSSARHGVESNFNESPEEYRMRVHKILHPKRIRR